MEPLFLTYFNFVKEDAVWLFPFVIGALVITFLYMFSENKRKFNKVMILLTIPFISLGIISSIYKGINYLCYGEYTITDRAGTNFHMVLSDIMKIDNKHTKNAWVTKESVYKAIEASPSLLQYKEFFDKYMYSDWGLTEDGQLHGDLFYWRFRFCLDAGGLYTQGGKNVDKFYKQVHKELQTAFKNGCLKEEKNVYHISSSLPNYTKKEFKGMLKTIIPVQKSIYSYEHSERNIKIVESIGSHEQILEAKEFTNSQIYTIENKRYKVNMNFEKGITKIYNNCGLLVGLIRIFENIIFIIIAIRDFRKKQFEKLPQLLIVLGLILTYILYFTILLWFGYKFIGDGWITYNYSHPAHLLLNITSFVGIYNLIKIIMKGSKKYEKK